MGHQVMEAVVGREYLAILTEEVMDRQEDGPLPPRPIGDGVHMEIDGDSYKLYMC